jgi:cadmium resistance protein CadD (predicted permease)
MEPFVDRHLGMLSASIATFTATNVDDAFLLTLFFARRIPTRRIVAGQYVGFSAIIGLSLIGVWCALAILGVLPLALGISRLVQVRPTDVSQPRVTAESVASIALLTLSNGADNISVYMPFFVMGRANLWLILFVYATLVAVWCFVGRWLGSHAIILRSVERWGHWIVPTVFVGLGVYVLTS